VPDGFFRPPFPTESYQTYLQSIAIKTADAKVMKFNGYEKKFICYVAVVEEELMDEDIMHGEHYAQKLRAQYLYNHSKYELIRFSYDDNRSISYQEWMDGMRFVWQDSIFVLDSISAPASGDIVFKKFMKELYSNSTSLGLNSDTYVLPIDQLSIGDVFIQPQDLYSPGHAVLILDMAVDPLTGEKLVLLGQGYTPAQNMHILANPFDEDISPWYRVKEDEPFFATAQWTFRMKHLRRFTINANSSNIWESTLPVAEDD